MQAVKLMQTEKDLRSQLSQAELERLVVQRPKLQLALIDGETSWATTHK